MIDKRECDQCKKHYKPTTTWQRCCSSQCRDKWHYLNRKSLLKQAKELIEKEKQRVS